MRLSIRRAIAGAAILLTAIPALAAAQSFPEGTFANFRSAGCDTPLTATCAYGWFGTFSPGNPTGTYFSIQLRPHSDLRIRAVGFLYGGDFGSGARADYDGSCILGDVPKFQCSIFGPDHLNGLGDGTRFTHLSLAVQYFAADAPSIDPTPIGTETLTLQRVVPEPGTYALLGTGLLALGGVATRRRRTA